MFAAKELLMIIRWRVTCSGRRQGRSVPQIASHQRLWKEHPCKASGDADDGEGPHQTPPSSFELIKILPRCFAMMELLANLPDFSRDITYQFFCLSFSKYYFHQNKFLISFKFTWQ